MTVLAGITWRACAFLLGGSIAGIAWDLAGAAITWQRTLAVFVSGCATALPAPPAWFLGGVEQREPPRKGSGG